MNQEDAQRSPAAVAKLEVAPWEKPKSLPQAPWEEAAPPPEPSYAEQHPTSYAGLPATQPGNVPAFKEIPGNALRTVGDAYLNRLPHQVLPKIAEGANVLGGLARTAEAAAISPFTPGGQTMGKEDLYNSLKGRQKYSDALAEQMGVPSGQFDVPVPLVGDVSVNPRKLIGTANDVASDPLTYLAGPIDEVAPGLKAVGNTMVDAGKSAYRWALKNVDKHLEAAGKLPISDVLMEYGMPHGSSHELGEAIKEVGDIIDFHRGKIYDKVNKIAGPIDMSKVSFERAEEQLAKMRKDERLWGLADELEADMNKIRGETTGTAQKDIGTVSTLKTNTANSLPQSAYTPQGALKDPADRFQRALAEDLRKAVVEHAEKAEPGLGRTVDNLNEQWGSVINSGKPMTQQINREVTKDGITAVDALGSMISPEAVGVKKALEVMKYPAVTTGAAKILTGIGKTAIPDAVLRQQLIQNQSPWLKMGGQK